MDKFLNELILYSEELNEIFGKDNWKFGGSVVLKLFGLLDRNINDLDIITKKNHYKDGYILNRIPGKSYTAFKNAEDSSAKVYVFGISLTDQRHGDVFYKKDYGDTIKLKYFDVDNLQSVLKYKHQAYQLSSGKQKVKHYEDLKNILSLINNLFITGNYE